MAVELAIVAPLLILFLIGAGQVGLVVLGNSVGSSAARDGVRAASIRYECADNHTSALCTANPSPNSAVIKAAVMARLNGLVKTPTVTVSVVCRQGSSMGTVILCEKGVVVPDQDVVEVTVTWRHIGETRFVTDKVHTAVARSVINGRPDLSSVAPPPDTVPPRLVPPILASDANVDGVIDTLTLEFDEDIQLSVSASAFTIANSPTGSNTIASAAVAARTVTLTLSGTTVNTAPGSMTVALAPSATGVRDTAGNQGTFNATTTTDRAGPKLTNLTDTAGLIDGRMGALDALTMTFSEPIATSLGTTTVSESDPGGSGKDSVTISGISAGAQLTNSTTYNTSSGSTLSVTALTTVSGNTVTVTIASPLVCTPLLCTGLGTGADSAPFSFTPSTTLVDAAGNAAVGSRTISNIF
ncbi:MAG: pilus assembly protein [Actinobacteria bacterium]|nr:pilus assembly protein [Actinomycetota bacterium]